jgi:hypothetical protein
MKILLSESSRLNICLPAAMDFFCTFFGGPVNVVANKSRWKKLTEVVALFIRGILEFLLGLLDLD